YRQVFPRRVLHADRGLLRGDLSICDEAGVAGIQRDLGTALEAVVQLEGLARVAFRRSGVLDFAVVERDRDGEVAHRRIALVDVEGCTGTAGALEAKSLKGHVLVGRDL